MSSVPGIRSNETDPQIGQSAVIGCTIIALSMMEPIKDRNTMVPIDVTVVKVDGGGRGGVKVKVVVVES